MNEWIAGEDIRTRCHCGNPGLYRCAWKLRKAFMIWAHNLREGDQMQIPKKLGYSQVVDITPGFTAAWLHVTLAVMPSLERFYSISPGAPLMVMRPGHCDAHCCENCAREVGEGSHHCRAHWDAGEREGALDQREEVEA